MTWPTPYPNRAAPEPIHAAERHPRLLGGVEGLRRLQADVAVAARRGIRLAEVAQQRLTAAAEAVGVADHRCELVQLDAHPLGIALVLVVRVRRATAAFDEAAHDGGVAEAEEQQGLGGQTVAAAAPGLLVVALDGLGQVVVHDEAHVALVDAHAEGDRGDDHRDLVPREGVLDAPPLVRRQAGVVGGGVHAVGAELAGDLLGALAREAVDDAGLAGVAGEELRELVQRLALVDHGVADVGPVEPGDVDGGVAQPEPRAHVVACLGVGRRRAGHDGHAGEQAAQLPELDVLGAEVVAPLADAVRLVDGEEGDAGLETVDALEEALGHERLGGDVQQVELAGVQGAQHAARLVRLERRVVGGGADAGRPQRVDLVLHQRDERRDDDAGAGPDHGRQLVTERLAAARGHEHERVAAGDQVVDDLLLMLPVLGEAEDVAQKGASRTRRFRGTGGDGSGDHDGESSKVDGRETAAEGRAAVSRVGWTAQGGPS